MYIETENKHPDIILLENRIRQLIKYEEYEKAAVVKQWIDWLFIHHENFSLKN